MNLTSDQKKHIVNLVKEGNLITEIRRVHFPKFTYAQIYSVSKERTDGGSMGLKKTITNRLNSLVNAQAKGDKDKYAKEIKVLVESLYKQHKDMASKLSEIRDALA